MEKSFVDALRNDSYRPEIRGYLEELANQTLNEISTLTKQGQELRKSIAKSRVSQDLQKYGINIEPESENRGKMEDNLEKICIQIVELEKKVDAIAKVKLQYQDNK